MGSRPGRSPVPAGSPQQTGKGAAISTRRRRKRAAYVARIDEINEQIAALAADDTWLAARQARKDEAGAFAADLDPGLDRAGIEHQAVERFGTTIQAAETVMAYGALEEQRRQQAQQQAEHDQRMAQLQERQQQQDRGRGGLSL